MQGSHQHLRTEDSCLCDGIRKGVWLKEAALQQHLPASDADIRAWQEKVPFNQTGSSRMQYITMLYYYFRWNVEASSYEQKTFWSLCSYMVRSWKGIEMLVNLVNIAYCAMKILPYREEALRRKHTGISVCP